MAAKKKATNPDYVPALDVVFLNTGNVVVVTADQKVDPRMVRLTVPNGFEKDALMPFLCFVLKAFHESPDLLETLYESFKKRPSSILHLNG